MPTKMREMRRPHRAVRLLLQLPIWLYRLHLGWLLGNRFLLLTHTGRKSGLPRLAVLEVLLYDKASATYCVASPWSEKPDWVLNVEKTPEVVIDVGGQRFPAQARRLSLEDAELSVLDYTQRHPLARRVLPRLMGYRLDGTEEDFRALARLVVVVAFHKIDKSPQ